jgi:hypothetical protein
MSDLTPKDVLEEYLAERDAAQFSINAGLLPDKWEREFQRTHDALALALARIEALGRRIGEATTHMANYAPDAAPFDQSLWEKLHEWANYTVLRSEEETHGHPG